MLFTSRFTSARPMRPSSSAISSSSEGALSLPAAAFSGSGVAASAAAEAAGGCLSMKEGSPLVT